jgi:UDPglucose 6-dehydrogenase
VSSPLAPDVVVAAGGLGTRVSNWSAFLPKELRPVDGRPAIVHALEEAAAAGAGRAVVVHHPYYTPLMTWLSHVIAPTTLGEYQRLTEQDPRLDLAALDVAFIPQTGRYADVTSALNGASHLGTGHIAVLFADNVDPSHAALDLLTAAAVPGHPAVLARPFDLGLAPTHGVIVCPEGDRQPTMEHLVEKPTPEAAAELADRFGPDRLRLLLGRLLLTPDVLTYLEHSSGGPGEPKLSLALAAYARTAPVHVITTTANIVDVGIEPGTGVTVARATGRATPGQPPISWTPEHVRRTGESHHIQGGHHMSQIAVFGAGYVGLVTAACFAELGHTVTVRDINEAKVTALRAGRVPIYEPGLTEMIERNAARLTFTDDADEAAAAAQIVYVCVDTPPTVSGDADLSRVWAVVESVRNAPHLAAFVVKSTVPVGTGSRIRAALDAAGLAGVGYASNPEFTAEGKAVTDFMQPDRVVIGSEDPATAALIAALHDGLDGPVMTMDVHSAEMVKLIANALLATRISFANEAANVCEATGADVEQVMTAVSADRRLGGQYLRPGIGWGGSCFPKDTVGLKAMASNGGYHFQLLSAVIEVNELQPRRAVIRLREELGKLVGRTVAVLGMTFKPGTDDMRESPATLIADRLLVEGATVRCWDPMARTPSDAPWSQATRCASPLEALAGADAAMLVTAWPELLEVDWAAAAAVMATPVLFDGRNLLNPAAMGAAGFTYISVGRATVRH